MPFGVRALRVEDLTLIGLAAMKSSTADGVAAELAAAVGRTGAPRAIVSDDGADLNGAVARFRRTHPGTAHVHDAAHRGANILKNRWGKDARWAAFVGGMTRTAPRIRQTPEAYLLPPMPRTKARFMNVGPLLRFAGRVLGLLGESPAGSRTRERYGWLEEYRGAVAGWRDEYEVVQAAVRRIRTDGVERGSVAAVEAEWAGMGLAAGGDVAARTRAMVREAGALAGPEETLVGSTEVLESAFGKLKRVEGSQAGGGFTGLALSLGAMMSGREEGAVREALEAVPRKEAEGWARRLFGPTIQWFRGLFLRGEPVPDPG